MKNSHFRFYIIQLSRAPPQPIEQHHETMPETQGLMPKPFKSLHQIRSKQTTISISASAINNYLQLYTEHFNGTKGKNTSGKDVPLENKLGNFQTLQSKDGPDCLSCATKWIS